MPVDWSLIANVASVVGTVGGLLFVWWQVRQIREVNASGLVRDEVKRWNSPEMRAIARLAQARLASRRDFERIEEQGGEEVTASFEDIGLLLRRRVVPVYYLWSMLADDITYYGKLLHDYLAWVRRSSADPWNRAKQVARAGWGEVRHAFLSANAYPVEQALHKRFEDVCVGGEWFDLTDEEVSRIRQLGQTDTVEDLPLDLRERPAGVVVRIRIDRRLLMMASAVASPAAASHTGVIRGTSVHDYLRTILISAIERDWEGIKHLVNTSPDFFSED